MTAILKRSLTVMAPVVARAHITNRTHTHTHGSRAEWVMRNTKTKPLSESVSRVEHTKGQLSRKSNFNSGRLMPVQGWSCAVPRAFSSRWFAMETGDMQSALVGGRFRTSHGAGGGRAMSTAKRSSYKIRGWIFRIICLFDFVLF